MPGGGVVAAGEAGDITRVVVDERPAVIGLIDGLFNTVPAVVHKEILFALTQGVRVLGAASMGALRAAELWTFGMQGVGEIFARFKEGVWDADDEVAVAHGPADIGFRPASVSLATIRLALEAAVDRGIVSGESAAGIVAALQRVFYPDRSWQRVLQAAQSLGLDDRDVWALQQFVGSEARDAKRDDALQLLRHIRSLLESGEQIPGPEVNFTFEPTVFWERLLTHCRTAARTGQGAANPAVSTVELAQHVQVQPDGAEIRRGAMLLYLIDQRRQQDPRNASSAGDLQAALDRFRRRRGLESSDDARAYYEQQALTDSELSLLAALEATLGETVRDARGELGVMVALELKRRGQFAAATQAAEHKRRVLDELGVNSLGAERTRHHDRATDRLVSGSFRDHHRRTDRPRRSARVRIGQGVPQSSGTRIPDQPRASHRTQSRGFMTGRLSPRITGDHSTPAPASGPLPSTTSATGHRDHRSSSLAARERDQSTCSVCQRQARDLTRSCAPRCCQAHKQVQSSQLRRST